MVVIIVQLCQQICMEQMIISIQITLMLFLHLFVVFMKQRRLVQRKFKCGEVASRCESFCMLMIWPTLVSMLWIWKRVSGSLRLTQCYPI
ncbi:hypothetical protein FH42_08630 [Klebsiella pneumoniae]|nr:hypothetical protein FH42_08630 [Klebsiella pneumoniae]